MALELVVGALLGTAVSELLHAVQDARTKISSFQPILKRLESTLVAITPRLHEIILLDQKLHLSKHQSGISELVVLVRDGKELVLKCSKVHHLNYVRKGQYSKLLHDLDTNLLRYFITVLQLDQFKDTREILVVLKELHCKLYPVNKDEKLGETEDEVRNINPREGKIDSKGEILKIMVKMKDGAEDSSSLKSDETLEEIEDEAEDSSFIKRDYQAPPPKKSWIRHRFSSSNSRDVSNSRNPPFKMNQQQFTYSDVVTITANFQRELGKGGFGTVYHGYLDGNQVAIKMLSSASQQGYRQFRAEAKLLMRVKHKNLTTLVGYCDEGNKQGLIYEYMAKSGLRSHLSERNVNVLSWEMRLNIMVDAAQGLEYLHTGCKPPIIHRDIKSRNILLNNDFEAKLADCEFSIFLPQEGETHMPVDTEFNMNEKSDIFSYGIVLLEIITGRPPILLERQGDVRSVVDSRLNSDFDVNSMWAAVDVARECVSNNTRPSMSQVVIEVKRCLDMEKARLNKRGKFI